MAGKALSIEPTIDPTAKVQEASFGIYCEVGARTILLDVEMGDYSYVVNDAQMTYTTIGKFFGSTPAGVVKYPYSFMPSRAVNSIGFIGDNVYFSRAGRLLNSKVACLLARLYRYQYTGALSLT